MLSKEKKLHQIKAHNKLDIFGYKVQLKYNEKEDLFSGEFTNINGLDRLENKDYNEIIKQAYISVIKYIDTCKENHEIPEILLNSIDENIIRELAKD